MNSSYVFLLARLVHVVTGVLWAGAVVFTSWFLLPSLRGAGAAGGTVMQQLVRVQRLPIMLMILAILTILSGFTLYYLDFTAFGPAWVHTGPGRTFSLGAAFAILAMIVGGSVSSPAARKIGELTGVIQASGTQPSPEQSVELGRLQNRLLAAGKAVAILILLAVACMGVARYVP